MSTLNLRELILNLYPNYNGISEAPILNDNSQVVGWHSSVILNDKSAIGSGASSDRYSARKIAVAEAVERAYFRIFLNDSVKKEEYILDKIPSSEGFAAGFDEVSSGYRSYCEAIERWAWSKWIDEKYFIPKKKDVTGSSQKNFVFLSEIAFLRYS